VRHTVRRQAEELFHRVVVLPPDRRAEYLDRHAGGDPRVRAEVESLVASLEETRIASLVDVDRADVSDVGRRIGPYEIVELIGEGGFGSVYLAEQREPMRRSVALKIIKLGMDTKQVITRFETERQTLARMEHPNIARVLDAGATDEGRPYFVLELVRGLPITRYCDRNRLAVRSRLELFVAVCHAVQHAHQKGVIHRDIKPSNVLVAVTDGVPVPKVIDFGIAKATEPGPADRTSVTEFQQFVGTPAYMSPEQAGPGGPDVDTRCDIYALGVLLYELLTGRTPIAVEMARASLMSEILRRIREEPVLRPSSQVGRLGVELAVVARDRDMAPPALGRRIRGDLDWIVMKAIEKDRARRYRTAAELADDVLRHLNHEPVRAGPPSALYRIAKFVRRHRVGVIAGGAVVLSLAVGLALATHGLIKADRAVTELAVQRDAAEAARRREATERARAEAGTREARRQARKAGEVKAFLEEMLESADPRFMPDGKPSLAHILEHATKRVEEGALAAEPQVEGDVRATLGKALTRLGSYDAARRHLERAVALLDRAVGREAPAALRAKVYLSEALRRTGRYVRADRLLQEVLEIQRRLFGEEDPRTADTLSQRAITLWRMGRHREGEALHRRALEVLERTVGESDRRTLTAMTGLAAAVSQQGRAAEAEALFRRILDIRRRTYGEDAPETVNVLINLAPLLAVRGEVEEAERMALRATEANRERLGAEHPVTLNAMSNLAFVLQVRGEHGRATSMLRETLATQRRVLGINHPDTRGSARNLLMLLNLTGAFAEAAALVEEQFDQYALAAKRPDVDAETLATFAGMLLDGPPPGRRDAVAAVAAARRAVVLSDGADAGILDTLARALWRTGESREAIRALRRAVSIDSAGRTGRLARLEQRLLDWSGKAWGVIGISMAVADIVSARAGNPADAARPGR
jgi:serine/threonine protein kinase/tetratricopeptide (TPR) repeat protein